MEVYTIPRQKIKESSSRTSAPKLISAIAYTSIINGNPTPLYLYSNYASSSITDCLNRILWLADIESTNNCFDEEEDDSWSYIHNNELIEYLTYQINNNKTPELQIEKPVIGTGSVVYHNPEKLCPKGDLQC